MVDVADINMILNRWATHDSGLWVAFIAGGLSLGASASIFLPADTQVSPLCLAMQQFVLYLI
jgi:hypothetical protein